MLAPMFDLYGFNATNLLDIGTGYVYLRWFPPAQLEWVGIT